MNPQLKTSPGGWIKLHRALLDNPRTRDPEWVAVWIWMLLSATHTPHEIIWNGKRLMLQPGQFTAGRHQISAETGVSQAKVWRLLETMKGEQQIEQRTSNVCSLFTILNWDSYQESEQPSEQQASSQRAANLENTPKIEQPSEQPVSSANGYTLMVNGACSGKSEQPSEQQASSDPPPYPSKSSTIQEVQEERNKSNNNKGSEIPSEDEVLNFAKQWPGDMSRGIPAGIPEGWVLNWIAWRMEESSGPFPPDWRNDIHRRFIAAWVQKKPSALGISKSMPGRSNPNDTLTTTGRRGVDREVKTGGIVVKDL